MNKKNNFKLTTFKKLNFCSGGILDVKNLNHNSFKKIFILSLFTLLFLGFGGVLLVPQQAQAATVTYDFESDTIGQLPVGTTFVRSGTAQPTVQNSATLGSKAVILNGENNRVDLLLNLVPLTSSSIDVSFRNPDNGSSVTRPSVLLFSNNNANQGYLVQWDSDANGLEIFKRNPGSPYTHTALANYGGQPSTTDYKWRTTATVSGNITTVTVYSWNGTSWIQELQTTDTTYNSGGVALNQISSTVDSEYDDIVVNYVDRVITISSPVQYQTFQRNGSNQADVVISGTYSGNPTAIESRFNGDSWQIIDNSPSGGTFSGILTNQSAGQGTLEVRFTNDLEITTLVSDIGIGDVFVIAGQSNAEGRGTNTQSYSHATLKAVVYDESDTWKESNDPVDTGTSSGSPWPLLATLFMADQGVPIAFITTAAGGTGLVNPADWQKITGTYYTTMINQINEATGNSGDIKAVLWHQGEKDTNSDGAGVTRATYNAALDQFVSDIKLDTVSTTKLITAQLGYKTTSQTTRDSLDMVRLAQSDAWSDNLDILAGPSLYDIGTLSDGVHFKTDAEIQVLANRWWAVLQYHFYSGADGRGPQISYAVENSNRDEITLVFTDDSLPLLPATSITGFRVEDDGNLVTISSIVRSKNNSIVLTLQSALTGIATISLGSGNDMGNLTDSSTYNLPAEHFIDQSIDKLPSSTFDNGFSIWESGNIIVNYNLIDADEDILNISQAATSGIEYSTDLITWADATDAGGASEGLTSLTSTTFPGIDHSFIWNSSTDLASTEDSTVYIRIRPNDGVTDASSWATSTAFGLDNVAPSSVGVLVFGTITTSSIEIIKPTTVTNNGSPLNQWQIRRGGATKLGLNATTTTSVTDSSLSENTQYTYAVQFNDTAGNTSSYGTSANKYTIVSAPTSLSASASSGTQIDLTATEFSNHATGTSGYYFLNTTLSTTSGWQSGDNTWSETGLACGNIYTYSVKYRNGDGVETATITTMQATNGCGGGGIFTSTSASLPGYAEPRLQTIFPDGTIVYHDKEDERPTKETNKEPTQKIQPSQPVYAFTTYLHVGSKGEEVTKLQETLRRLKYFTYPENTRYFGSVTEQAVKEFQKANEIETLGVVGPKTRLALNDLDIQIHQISTQRKSNLTQPQVNSIIKLLEAFDIDKEVIKRVSELL